MNNWVSQGLGQGDHVHLTGPGYLKMGDMFYEDLMKAYAAARASLGCPLLPVDEPSFLFVIQSSIASHQFDFFVGTGTPRMTRRSTPFLAAGVPARPLRYELIRSS